MSAPHIIALGEAMVELSLDTHTSDQARVGFAGDTLNTAIYLKRALPQARVSFATKLGGDAFSRQMRAMMRNEGLETDLVLESPDKGPGLYAITTDAAGERSFTYWRSASAARDLFAAPALDLERLAGASVLYFTAISLAILPQAHRDLLLDWLPEYRRGGGRVAFDSNYRPKLWESRAEAEHEIARTWRQTDFGFPSLDDEQAIFEDRDEAATLMRLQGYGLRHGALKRGARGPVGLDGAQAAPCPPVARVVDSTAAGDSFNAAFLAATLSGASMSEALQAGHGLASRVIATRGAILPRAAMAEA